MPVARGVRRVRSNPPPSQPEPRPTMVAIIRTTIVPSTNMIDLSRHEWLSHMESQVFFRRLVFRGDSCTDSGQTLQNRLAPGSAYPGKILPQSPQKLNEFFPFGVLSPEKMEIEIGFGAFWRIFFQNGGYPVFHFLWTKLNEFFPLQGVILSPLSPIWKKVASTSPL